MRQNPTVSAFLVANIEKVASVLTLIVGGILYYARFGGVEVVPESAKLVLGALVVNVLVAFAWHGTIMQLLIFFWIIFKLDEIDSWQAIETPIYSTFPISKHSEEEAKQNEHNTFTLNALTAKSLFDF